MLRPWSELRRSSVARWIVKFRFHPAPSTPTRPKPRADGTLQRGDLVLLFAKFLEAAREIIR